MIETSPNIQFIMPFILKNIEENYEAIIYNGALKKNLYVMVIDALFNNELIKMDFHVGSFKPETYHYQDPGDLHNNPYCESFFELWWIDSKTERSKTSCQDCGKVL